MTRSAARLAPVLALCLACAPPQDSAPGSMPVFLEWLPGDYDNNEQVWQQGEDAVPEAERDVRIHHRVVPVSAPALGEHVFLIARTDRDDAPVPGGLTLVRAAWHEPAAEIRLEGFAVPDGRNVPDTLSDLRGLSRALRAGAARIDGCDLAWRPDGPGFSATLPADACPFHFEPASAHGTLRLTEGALELRRGPALEVHRRARRFSGWMGVEKRTVDPGHPEDGMFFTSGFSIHDEGGYRRILDEAGQPTGYAIELARLTYQATRVPILKLGVVKEATGETVSYTWASTDASRIGINLRWFQAGLTAAAPGGDPP